MFFQRIVLFTVFLCIVVGARLANANILNFLTYSTTATESYVTFQGKVGLRSSSTPTQTEAKQQVRKQIKWMQSHWRRTTIASLRPDFSINITGIEKVADKLYRVKYRFTGTALVLNVAAGPIEVIVPVNPDTVETTERLQFCQDPDYGAGAFWYYWNPRAAACTMIQDKDYYVFQGSFTNNPATVQTYPEYNRLFTNGVMRAVILFGKVSDQSSDDPSIGNPWSYPVLRKALSRLGFNGRRWSSDEIKQFVGSSYQSEPHIEEFSLQTAKGLISLTVFYGNTGIKEDSAPFHRMYKFALENASLISYGGHAGTGKNLNIEMLRSQSGLSFSARSDLYQILHLSACFPYAYYVTDYFKFKATPSDPRGSRNLDILAEGVEGSFGGMGPQAENIIKAIVAYANQQTVMSYQQILQSNEWFAKALFSVNGDEDNPTSAANIP